MRNIWETTENWENEAISSGLVTRRLYFLKKRTLNGHFSRPAETDPYMYEVSWGKVLWWGGSSELGVWTQSFMSASFPPWQIVLFPPPIVDNSKCTKNYTNSSTTVLPCKVFLIYLCKQGNKNLPGYASGGIKWTIVANYLVFLYYQYLCYLGRKSLKGLSEPFNFIKGWYICTPGCLS